MIYSDCHHCLAKMASQQDGMIIDSRSDQGEVECSEAKCELGMATDRGETDNGVKNPGRVAKQEKKTERSEKIKDREYKKENTVELFLKEKLDLNRLVDEIELQCGVGSVFACVTTGPNTYELTMVDALSADMLKPGFYAEDKEVKVETLYEGSVVVSVMDLPAYIPDSQIITKIKSYDIKILSEIHRRLLEREDESLVEDGTRYFRVKFPEGFTCLPYALKFETLRGMKYFRVIHNGQVKVCYNCLSPDHVRRNCPKNMCFVCKKMGHISFDCPEKSQPKYKPHRPWNQNKWPKHNDEYPRITPESDNQKPHNSTKPPSWFDSESWLTMFRKRQSKQHTENYDNHEVPSSDIEDGLETGSCEKSNTTEDESEDANYLDNTEKNAHKENTWGNFLNLEDIHETFDVRINGTQRETTTSESLKENVSGQKEGKIGRTCMTQGEITTKENQKEDAMDGSKGDKAGNPRGEATTYNKNENALDETKGDKTNKPPRNAVPNNNEEEIVVEQGKKTTDNKTIDIKKKTTANNRYENMNTTNNHRSTDQPAEDKQTEEQTAKQNENSKHELDTTRERTCSAENEPMDFSVNRKRGASIGDAESEDSDNHTQTRNVSRKKKKKGKNRKR